MTLDLPQRIAAYILIAVLTIGIAACIVSAYNQSVIDEHEREAAEQVAEKKQRAEQAAADTQRETQTKIEKENADARKAANAGTDPLRDGLNSLRGNGTN